jgi:hypothetical protein
MRVLRREGLSGLGLTLSASGSGLRDVGDVVVMVTEPSSNAHSDDPVHQPQADEGTDDRTSDREERLSRIHGQSVPPASDTGRDPRTGARDRSLIRGIYLDLRHTWHSWRARRLSRAMERHQQRMNELLASIRVYLG